MHQFWPTQLEFNALRENYLNVWVKAYSDFAQHYGHLIQDLSERAQEVIDLILWMTDSLTKLRNELFIDWHWESKSLSVFKKNIKQITKGLKVNEIEIDQIYNVINEGTDGFIKTISSCLQNVQEDSKEINSKLKTLEEYDLSMEHVRTELKDSIMKAAKYLEHERKKLK